MEKRGFTLIELLLTLMVLAIIGGFAIPQWRKIQVRNDLNVATEQTRQMLQSAQIRSQLAERDDVWSVQPVEGIIFKGSDFASRDTGFDERHPVPGTVTISGLETVTYSRLYGIPSQTGSILLQSLFGETREILVSDESVLGPGSRATLSEDVQIQISFLDVRNQGNGSAEAASYVGPLGTYYSDGAWIDIIKDGQAIVDNGLVVGATGLAVERGEGFIRIVAYGDLDSGGKEIIDAQITIVGGIVDSIDDGEGDFETENAFDGNVSNGVGGDEITLLGESSVLFQTRTTNFGDTAIINWSPKPDRWMNY